MTPQKKGTTKMPLLSNAHYIGIANVIHNTVKGRADRDALAQALSRYFQRHEPEFPLASFRQAIAEGVSVADRGSALKKQQWPW
jgi:hypothetical protein